LDYVCVVFKPNDIQNFDLSWANYKNFKHSEKWREYEPGEGDYLAEISLKETKNYIVNYLNKNTLKQEKVSIKRENLEMLEDSRLWDYYKQRDIMCYIMI